MLRLSVALIPSLATSQAESAATPSAPTCSGSGERAAFTIGGMHFHEEPLTAGEAAVIAGESGSGSGLVIVSDADFEALQDDTACQAGSCTEQSPRAASAATGRPTAAAAAPLYVPLPVEQLREVELCVVTPPLREEWPVSAVQPNEGGEGGLFCSELSWRQLDGREPTFLCLYALAGDGPGATLSRGMKEALERMATRMLRLQLARLLRHARLYSREYLPNLVLGDDSEPDDGDDDGASDSGDSAGERPTLVPAVVEALRRHCVPLPAPGGLRVTWDAELLTTVAATIGLRNVQGSERPRAERPPVEVAEEDGVEPMQRDASGLEAWSSDSANDDDDHSSEDGSRTASAAECPLNESDVEGRAVWQLRHAAVGERRGRGRRQGTAAPAPTAPPPHAAVVAPLTLRNVPVAQTALSLLLREARIPSRGRQQQSLPLQKDSLLRVHFLVESVAVVRESCADTAVATAYAEALFQRYVQPAEARLGSGTSSFQAFARLSRQPPAAGEEEEEERNLEELLREALDDYAAAAHCAQEGLLDPYRHAPRRPMLTAMGEGPITGSADDAAQRLKLANASMVRVYEVIEDFDIAHALKVDHGCSTVDAEAVTKEIAARVRFCRHLLLPLHVPGEDYFNKALLRTCAVADRAEWLEQPSVAAARRATQWRCETAAPALRSDPFPPLSLPSPTALQHMLYALRRLVVTATANAALVATTLAERWQQRLSIHALEAYAVPCGQASALVLSLLRLQAPFPTATDSVGPETAAEVRWCFSMYCKLRLRGARLYALAGSTAVAQRWCAELGDAVDRWDRHRRRAARTVAPVADAAAFAWAGASTSPEAMVCGIAEDDWAKLVAEVREALRLLMS